MSLSVNSSVENRGQVQHETAASAFCFVAQHETAAAAFCFAVQHETAAAAFCFAAK
ncbi:hypothetical protein GCM10010191_75050 [Actinomadura vinacea]|uniref:Uncharacterized protein n=1 Tax=Actinomadura vinacea TaxID=115336 RepID=A0ABN3K569_9ACTN